MWFWNDWMKVDKHSFPLLNCKFSTFYRTLAIPKITNRLIYDNGIICLWRTSNSIATITNYLDGMTGHLSHHKRPSSGMIWFFSYYLFCFAFFVLLLLFRFIRICIFMLHSSNKIIIYLEKASRMHLFHFFLFFSLHSPLVNIFVFVSSSKYSHNNINRYCLFIKCQSI